MSSLKTSLEDYFELRRNLGYSLLQQRRALPKFVQVLASHSKDFITCQDALEWALSANGRVGQCLRLSYARQFAKYLSAFDSRTEVPSPDLIPFRWQRPRPYIYRHVEIQLLLKATLEMPVHPRTGVLRRWSYYCLFGLIYVTGMRLSEAMSLRLNDINIQQKLLTVRFGKFGKPRILPISGSTADVLREYLALHAEAFAGRQQPPFLFPTSCGGRLSDKDIHVTFYKLSRSIGIRGVGAKTGPRIHDLRHTFAVDALVRWYDSGRDPMICLPLLATYLGHVGYEHTYWYLSLCPELMRVSLDKAERAWGAA
ncbi:tyrosine-type recombinase/integrase [Caballeronia sp. M23-90]